MAINSNIEWTERTWNCFIGCSKKSKGCMNCYAIKTAWRLMHNPHPKIAKKYEGTVAKDSSGKLNWTGRVNFDEETLLLPLKVQEPSMIFADSMSDMFHPNVKDEWLDRAFAVMALCLHHTFQVVTKHPDRMLAYMKNPEREALWMNAVAELIVEQNIKHAPILARTKEWLPLPNVWLITSTEDQQTADERIPYLLQCPAAVRGISAEPLLGPINIVPYVGGNSIKCGCGYRETGQGVFGAVQKNAYCSECSKKAVYGPTLDWVIVGFESGYGARPGHGDWARKLRDDCVAAGVAFFFKQHGNWLHQSQEYADGLTGKNSHVWPDGTTSQYTNKRAAGRILDGRTWDEFPQSEVAK